MPAYDDPGLGELLDLPLERSLDVHNLDDDNRHFLHMLEEITGSLTMCQGDRRYWAIWALL
jgi:hypothetical protein